MNSSFLKQTRIDCILIWGHGLNHFDDILYDIRANKNFETFRIQRHKPKSMKNICKRDLFLRLYSVCGI